jgi:hypothetical protein
MSQTHLALDSYTSLIHDYYLYNMPPHRTQPRLPRDVRRLCRCHRCLASNPDGRWYNRSTVWRHNNTNIQAVRNRNVLVCRDCPEEHQVLASEADAHQQDVQRCQQSARVAAADAAFSTPNLDPDDVGLEYTQTVPNFSVVDRADLDERELPVVDELQDGDLDEDELNTRHALQGFGLNGDGSHTQILEDIDPEDWFIGGNTAHESKYSTSIPITILKY